MEMTPDTTDFNSLSKKQLVELVIAKYNDCFKLEEENKKLKEINESQNEEIQRFKDNAMQDMREITELEIENRKLKEENEDLKQIIKLSKSYEEGKNKLKEVYIKNTAKFLDKKFPAINGFMEEDTLQELRDLGKI